MKNPHDKFFKETLTQRENALSFFREYLPADIVAKLDWRTLKITKDTFVEPELRERFSDIVYKIRAKGRQIFIYLLLEHQSTVDAWMSLRLLGYIVRIWELYRKQNPEAEKLPGIEEIKGSIILRLFLNLMSRIFSPGFVKDFERMIPLFTELSHKKTGMEYIETVLRYICHASDTLTWKDMETRLIQAFEDDRKGVIMTIADELRMQGEIKGEIKGKIKGEIKGEIKGKIKTYQELLNYDALPSELAEQARQKIAELKKKLKEVTGSDVDEITLTI
ncbi:MAG: Rpn family recombination-promoting nuclease/putative transposase [Desulfobacterales bacterium]|nr:Rpn family recombination-promoting nuclease/putative transposase [Desulfobacterales bacterium]